ncbi:hypothetical protein L1887_53944 [Cichorium endivia]|nr:hypothetical protein L1887_53944 [Cichorium endivia]
MQGLSAIEESVCMCGGLGDGTEMNSAWPSSRSSRSSLRLNDAKAGQSSKAQAGSAVPARVLAEWRKKANTHPTPISALRQPARDAKQTRLRTRKKLSAVRPTHCLDVDLAPAVSTPSD